MIIINKMEKFKKDFSATITQLQMKENLRTELVKTWCEVEKIPESAVYGFIEYARSLCMLRESEILILSNWVGTLTWNEEDDE